MESSGPFNCRRATLYTKGKERVNKERRCAAIAVVSSTLLRFTRAKCERLENCLQSGQNRAKYFSRFSSTHAQAVLRLEDCLQSGQNRARSCDETFSRLQVQAVLVCFMLTALRCRIWIFVPFHYFRGCTRGLYCNRQSEQKTIWLVNKTKQPN